MVGLIVCGWRLVYLLVLCRRILCWLLLGLCLLVCCVGICVVCWVVFGVCWVFGWFWGRFWFCLCSGGFIILLDWLVDWIGMVFVSFSFLGFWCLGNGWLVCLFLYWWILLGIGWIIVRNCRDCVGVVVCFLLGKLWCWCICCWWWNFVVFVWLWLVMVCWCWLLCRLGWRWLLWWIVLLVGWLVVLLFCVFCGWYIGWVGFYWLDVWRNWYWRWLGLLIVRCICCWKGRIVWWLGWKGSCRWWSCIILGCCWLW